MKPKSKKLTRKQITLLVMRARKYMCMHCKGVKRGGTRAGAELCEDCYQGDTYL